MSPSSNDPPPTSIQAGRPSPGRTPDETDAPESAAAPSQLDVLLATLKAQERWWLALGVGVQLVVLAGLLVLGAAKGLGGVLR